MWRPFLKRLFIGKIQKRFTKEIPKNLKCVDMISKRNDVLNKNEWMNIQPMNAKTRYFTHLRYFYTQISTLKLNNSKTEFQKSAL